MTISQYLKLFIVIAFIGLVGSTTFYCNEASKEKSLRTNIERTIEDKNDTIVKIRQYHDSLSISQTKVIESNSNTFRKLFNDVLEDFKKSTGKDIKNLQSALKTQINGVDTIYIVNRDSLTKDSTKISSFQYNDQFNKVLGTIYDHTTTLVIERSLFLTAYEYTKRKGEPWYKPWKWGKVSVIDVRSENPSDKVVDIKKINIIR